MGPITKYHPLVIGRLRRRFNFALLLCVAVCCSAHVACADSLEQKLLALTDYIPKAEEPLDQLIEVAQRFKVPMGVEWVERDDAAQFAALTTDPHRKRTVRELIEEIAARSPGQQVFVEDKLLRIYSPAVAEHPFNFLNIRLRSYSVHEDDIFAAEDKLRWAIRFTLNPEKYRHGYGGGYGRGWPEVFQFPRFTLTAERITIREILNRITEAQGNALWVVRLKDEELKGRAPYWKGKDPDELALPLTTRWHFLPLAEIDELATEQLVVELKIEGLLDQRIATIPVMMEHGLHGGEGGGTGIARSDGNFFFYGTHVERMEPDSVTLSVTLRVTRANGPLRSFAETLRVNKNGITELSPETGIILRAHFEPRPQTSKE